MAGLDKPNIPFNTSFTNGSFMDIQNNKVKNKPSQPSKITRAPTSQTNTYYGDIYSNKAPRSQPPVSQENVEQGGIQMSEDKDDTHPQAYPPINDPTMSSHVNTDYEIQQSKPDDLYEKLLQDTSGVFQHLGDSNINVNQSQDSNKSVHEKSEDKSSAKEKLLDFRKSKTKGKNSLTKKSKNIVDDSSEKLSDDDHDGRQSRLGDVHYSVDSFEQSYVSERGELIRLDGDLESFDLGGRSPSPPAQTVESDDEF